MESVYYKPYFSWQRGEPKPNTTSPSMYPLNAWDDSAPCMLLSDSDDEGSITDTPERQPLHESYEDEPSLLNERHVRFGEACIREHPVIMGDHTACCDVWPLSLDWAFREEKVYDIDYYETMRERSGRSQRGRLTKLGASERRRILEQAGWDLPKRNKIEGGSNEEDAIDVQATDPSNAAVEVPADPSPGCNPFAVFQDAGWGLCGFGGDFPTMKVEILED